MDSNEIQSELVSVKPIKPKYPETLFLIFAYDFPNIFYKIQQRTVTTGNVTEINNNAYLNT